MKYKLITALLVSVLFYSCSKNSEKNLKEISFRQVDVMQFKLDDESSGRSGYYNFIDFEGAKLLTFLNKKNNSIYLYSLEDQSLIQKLQFEKTGPNGVGEISGYLIENEDSIYVYSYNGRRVSLLNKNLEVVKGYSVISKEREVNPQIGSLRKMYNVGGNLILNSWGSQKEYYKNESYPKSILTFLNLENGELEHDVSYPAKYTEGVWGVQLHEVYHDLKTGTNELVLNFPIDDKIYIYDIEKGILKSHNVKNNNPLIISPLSKSEDKISIDLMTELKTIKSQNTYYFVKYLNEIDTYIRVINKKIPEEDLNSSDPFKLSFGESIFQFINKDFELIGEVNFGKSHFLPSMFYQNGYIFIEKFQTENEDALEFDMFNLSF